MDGMHLSFGDKVRVRSTPVTEALGLAGLVGQVYGLTTPSITKVEVIGELEEDHAINVHFDGRRETRWLATQLLDFIDHAPGTTVTLDGIPKKWVRAVNGDWVVESISATNRKPWWQFW